MLKLSVISAAVVVYAMKASMEVAGHQTSTFSTIEPFPSQACDFSSEHGGADIVVFGDSLSDCTLLPVSSEYVSLCVVN